MMFVFSDQLTSLGGFSQQVTEAKYCTEVISNLIFSVAYLNMKMHGQETHLVNCKWCTVSTTYRTKGCITNIHRWEGTISSIWRRT